MSVKFLSIPIHMGFEESECLRLMIGSKVGPTDWIIPSEGSILFLNFFSCVSDFM